MPVPTLTAALQSEWIKLSTLRSNRVLAWMTLVAGAVTSWAVATFVTDEMLVASQVYVYSTVLTAMFAAVSGLTLFTSEVQHGTLAASLTAQPSRRVVVGAKALLAAGRGLTLGAVGMAAGFVAALAAGLDAGDTSGLVAGTAWALVFTTLAALLGLGVGMAVRHGAAALTGLFAWWFVAENMLAIVMPPEILRFLPFYAGNGLLTLDSDFTSPDEVAVALTDLQNALVFGGFTALALAIGAVVLRRS